MEQSCMVAHGAAEVLADRMHAHSDPCSIEVHASTGLMPTPASRFAPGSRDDIIDLDVPYALKLLAQELAAVNIRCRLVPDACDT
jgi:DNA-directed RNA polymerase beta subunit